MTNHNKVLIYIVLISVLFDNLFIDFFGAPSAIRYLNDGIILLLLLCCLKAIRKTIQQTGIMNVIIAVFIYSLALVPGIVINGSSPLLLLWAVRNTYRFFSFYIICICILNKEDIIHIFELFCKLQYLNLIVCLVQYFILGKTRDYLGGIFGAAKGCNAYLNIYLCIVLSYVIFKYLREKVSTVYMLYILFSTMLIAGLAELKIVFIEIIIIIAAAMVLDRNAKRMWMILAFGLAAIVIGLAALMVVAPEHFRILTNLNRLIAYANSETGGYHLSRFHAFSNINRIFFNGDWVLNLFGFGFGNCEYSSFSFLQSPFYREYGYYNYRWFSHQMIFLETGYFGFLTYVCIFVAAFFNMWRSRKKYVQDRIIYETAIIMCLITMMNIWYDASLKSECGYMIWFVMAAAGAANKMTDRIDKKAVICAES